MSKKANPALVGSFILGAILLSVVGLLLLGGGSLLDEKIECVLYFDESISGLDIGAPVDFQGVRIGTVTDVRLEFNDTATGEIARPVQIKIEGKRIHNPQGWKKMSEATDVLETLVVQRGLRARLATQSLLTGKLKVELGFFPDRPIRRVAPHSDPWEMPTIPSPLQAVTEEMAQLPIGAIVQEIHRAVQGVADMLAPEHAGQTVNQLNQTLSRLEAVLAQIQEKIEPAADKSSGFLRTAQTSLEDLQAIFRRIDQELPPLVENLTQISKNVSAITDPDSLLRDELSRLLEEMRATSQSIRYLADSLEEHPESLLRGKKGP